MRILLHFLLKVFHLKKIPYYFIYIVGFQVNAQEQCITCKPFDWEIGVPIGINQYFGDMHCSMPYPSSNNLMSGVFARRFINNYTSLRGNLLIGKLAGNDLDQPEGRWDYRRLKFSSPLTEISLMGEFFPFKERKYNCEGIFIKGLRPYLFGGIGLVFTNPTVLGQNAQLQNDDPRKYVIARLFDEDQQNLKKTALTAPFGLGFKANIAERYSLALEVAYRFAFSDYLDGTKLSTTALGTGSAFEPNGPSYNDGYLLANISLSYRIGDKDTDKDGIADKCDKCPRIKGERLFEGCPDTDGDGIHDKADICPDDFGDPATCGCPDDDGDGIPNSCDCCPNEKGSRETHGCSGNVILHSIHVNVTSSQKLCNLCPDYLPLAKIK